MSEEKLPIEEYIRRRDEMGLGTGVSNLQREYGMSSNQAHEVLTSLHNSGVVRYHAAEQEDGERIAELIY